MTTQQPNILCIITDQQRADHMSCAGNSVLRTPNIDRIAASGTRFDRAYVNCPLCMPGRATLFTGRTPRGHGVRTNGIDLDPQLPTMPQALVDAGYRTHSVGKLHLRRFMDVSGLPVEEHNPAENPELKALWLEGTIDTLPTPYFGMQSADYVGAHGGGVFGDYLNWLKKEDPDAVKLLSPEHAREPLSGADQSYKMALPAELHYTPWVAGRTIDFLDDAAANDEPFFLWSSFADPHHPYCPPAPYDSMYDPAEMPLPNRREGELDDLAPFFRQSVEEGIPLAGRQPKPARQTDAQMREIIAHTYGMIALLDDHVGRILNKLDELGLRENTIVMFMSDHGDMMGDHWLLNKGPFHFEGLLRVPFIWSWPGHIAEGVTTEALASLLDFAPTVLDLCNVPIPEGDVPPKVEAVQQSDPWPGRSLRPVLLGKATSVQDAVVVENDEDYLGLQLRTLVTERYKLTIYQGQEFGELFDLQEDPNEQHNCWHDPAYASICNELSVQLLHELIRTDSVLPRRLGHA